MQNWLREKLIYPLLSFLKQGTTPTTLAWSVALGFVLGIFPIIGLTTLLCFISAFLFRLNIAAIQLVNYAVYPLQLLLLIPYFQLASWLFGTENPVSSISQVQALFQEGFWQAFSTLGWLLIEAVFVWAIFALPLSFLVYILCYSVFRKYIKNKNSNSPF
jgi:uncharacterized protein (TIGR03546 family)